MPTSLINSYAHTQKNQLDFEVLLLLHWLEHIWKDTDEYQIGHSSLETASHFYGLCIVLEKHAFFQ